MVRRNYIADSQKPSGATDAQVALAEELIDQYVGYQERAVEGDYLGQASVHDSTAKTITDTNNTTQLSQANNFYAGCIIEIIGGTGAGSIRNITASNRDNKSITYSGAALTIDTTSIFKIYQLAKFPRVRDTRSWTPANATQPSYYRTIPQAIQEAVIAEVEFIIEMGDDYFTGDDSDMDSESIGNYSYNRGKAGGQSSLVKMIAPKTRTILRGIKNSGGRVVAENPTCL
jgi:hypothetical protein